MDKFDPSDPQYTPTARLSEVPEQQLEGRDYRVQGRFAPDDQLAGRFQIVRWIASGGMGEVYEARDLELGERVAVKIIRPEIAADNKAMERFRREISLARQVTHPNVCRIFDFFYHAPDGSGSGTLLAVQASRDSASADSVAFLTMELLVGETLSEAVSPGVPLSIEQALPIIRQMALALGAAHDAGVLHRDFKCSNVILVDGSPGSRGGIEREETPWGPERAGSERERTREGSERARTRAVVTDFGLARSLMRDSEKTDVTVQGEILGSPAYMAPEQALGLELTPAADIYALGVVIYRMVTGRLPLEASSPFALLAKRMKEDAPPPSQWVEDLDPRWDRAISKCLAREPEARFASAYDLLAALEPETAARPPKAYRRRLQRRFIAASLSLLGLAGLALYVWHPKPRPTAVQTAAAEARSSVAVLEFNNLSGRPEAAWLSAALTELLTTELAASEQLRIIPGETVSRMQHDLELPRVESLAQDTLQRVGQHLGSEYVLLGSYFAAGEAGDHRLRLDLRLQRTSDGQTIATLSETMSEKELLSLVDRLGGELRQQLGIDQSGFDAMEARASMPANLEAARLYTEGLSKLRGFDMLGARNLLLEAVVADSEFPLARVALAQAHSALGYDPEAAEQIRLAFEQSREATLQERLLIEGKFRELTGDWDGAGSSYRELFEAFPDQLDYGLDLARTQIQAGRSDDAEETFEVLRRLPSPSSDDPRIDTAEFQLAMSSAQYSRGLEAARRSLEKSRRIGARWLAAHSRQLEADALRQLGQLAEAEAAAQDVYSATLELGDRSGAAKALDSVATLRFFRNEFEESLAAHTDALAIYREIGSRSGTFSVLNNKAITLYFLGEFEESARLREEALDIARILGVKEKIVLSLANLAVSRQVLGDSASALRLYEESLDISRQIDNPQLIARRLYNVASILREKDLNSARAKFQEAITLFREQGRAMDLVMGLSAMAHLDMQQDDLSSARGNLEAAAEIQRQSEQEVGVIETRYFQALLAYEEGRFEEAVELAGRLSEDLARLKRGPQEADALSIRALASLASGQQVTARQAFDRISELVSEAVRDGMTLHYASIEARLLAAEGQMEASLSLLESELSRSRQIGRFDRQLTTRLAMAEIELHHGRQAAGLERLATLVPEAEAAGFHRIARKAREMSRP